MKALFRTAAIAAAALAAVVFTACDDDKEGGKAGLTVADMVGEYTGTFDFTPSPSDLNPNPEGKTGVSVAFNVKDGKIFFPEFPAATLVTALVGEDGAAGLIPLLGTITYEASIGKPSANASSLSATLTTPVLRIDVGGAMVVLINIESPGKMIYSTDGSLAFTLKTVRCQIGEGESAGEPFDLVNDLVFKVKKK